MRLLVVLLLCVSTAAFASVNMRGFVGTEFRYFAHEGLYGNDDQFHISPSFEPEWYYESEDMNHLITFKPYFRLDSVDADRSHWDIRDLSWLGVYGDMEWRVGLRKVFWGVTETQHLVDIINQTDLVESPDGEDKLGQPMVNVSFAKSYGTIDLFVLPFFRARTFPGVDGRFRASLPVSTSPEYESHLGDRHIDWAARWSHSVSVFDIRVSYFSGTSRDPIMQLESTPEGGYELVPLYTLIQQRSLDLQATLGAWLLKFEGLSRQHQDDVYSAFVSGFEYSFYAVKGTSVDVGFLSEYHYDDRGSDASTPFQDDVFLGTRIALNDIQSTEVLAGATTDVNSSATFFNVEASRRIGDRLKLIGEFRAFMDVPSDDLFSSYSQDDYALVTLEYYF